MCVCIYECMLYVWVCFKEDRGQQVSSFSAVLSLMSWEQNILLSLELGFSTRLAVSEPHCILLCLLCPQSWGHPCPQDHVIAAVFQMLALMSIWKSLFSSEPAKFLLMKIFKLPDWVMMLSSFFLTWLLFFFHFVILSFQSRQWELSSREKEVEFD